MSVVGRVRAVPLGIKHDPRRVGGLCAPNGTRAQAYQTPPKLAAAGGRQLNYCCQSTAAATEASPGALGGLFGCSQHTKSKTGRKNIFFVKKRAYGGTTVDPHMPIFLTKKSFFGPAGFSTVKNSQKGPQTHLGLLPLLQQCSGNGISTATACGAPYAHFFYEKNFFRPSLIFRRQEQPKRRPKPPGLASIATAVLWQQYFNCHNRGRIERN